MLFRSANHKAETIGVRLAATNSTTKAVDAYMKIKDAFVEDDTAAVKKNAAQFLACLDSISLEDLKKDSNNIYEGAKATFQDIKANIESMVSQNDITEMRRDFNNATMNMPQIFGWIHYNGNTLYLQRCPMAFGENQGANWLSNSREIVNPYLGKNHPVYHSSMLHCGEIIDSVTAN